MADDEWSPYPDPNRPPPPPDASVVGHYARMNPLGRALANALTSLAEDDELGMGNDDSSYGPSRQHPGKSDERIDEDEEEQSDDNSTGEKRGRKRPRQKTDCDVSSTVDNEKKDATPAKVSVDDKLKEHLLQSFGDAVAKTDWYGQNNVEEGKSPSTTNKSHPVPKAPSGLLRGKVKHYNRFGRQWRILAEDVEIRPRVRLEKDGRLRRRGHQKRSERQSLWERSLEHDEEQIQVAGTGEAAGEAAGDSDDPAAVTASTSTNGPDLEGLDVEGNTVRIKGDVLILAYDDV